MDLFSVALILIGLWVAIVVVCVALARAAGRSDVDADRMAARGEPTREPLAQSSPLDVLADQLMRSTAGTGASAERGPQQPVRDRRAVAKRFRTRSCLTTRPDRIKNLLH
jgi:hypothetical protein